MFKQVVLSAPGEVAATQTSSVVDISKINPKRATLTMNISAISSPTAKTFVDGGVNTTFDQITSNAHGFKTGLKVALTTDGVLPTGLSATDYYVIYNDGNVIQLATTMANAVAGVAVNITAAAGGGTHTLTPAALANGALILQASSDGTNYYTLESTAVAAAGLFKATYEVPACTSLKGFLTLTAGQLTAGDMILCMNEDL